MKIHEGSDVIQRMINYLRLGREGWTRLVMIFLIIMSVIIFVVMVTDDDESDEDMVKTEDLWEPGSARAQINNNITVAIQGMNSTPQELAYPEVAVERQDDVLMIDYSINELEGNEDTFNFDPGEFLLSDIPGSENRLHVLMAALDEYIKTLPKGYKYGVKATINGHSDGLRVRQGSMYTGELGIIRGVAYCKPEHDFMKRATMIPNETLMTNERFAFLRAFGAYDYLKDFDLLKDAEFKLFAIENSRVGAAYRKTIVSLTIERVEIPAVMDGHNS